MLDRVRMLRTGLPEPREHCAGRQGARHAADSAHRPALQRVRQLPCGLPVRQPPLQGEADALLHGAVEIDLDQPEHLDPEVEKILFAVLNDYSYLLG